MRLQMKHRKIINALSLKKQVLDGVFFVCFGFFFFCKHYLNRPIGKQKLKPVVSESEEHLRLKNECDTLTLHNNRSCTEELPIDYSRLS